MSEILISNLLTDSKIRRFEEGDPSDKTAVKREISTNFESTEAIKARAEKQHQGQRLAEELIDTYKLAGATIQYNDIPKARINFVETRKTKKEIIKTINRESGKNETKKETIIERTDVIVMRNPAGTRFVEKNPLSLFTKLGFITTDESTGQYKINEEVLKKHDIKKKENSSQLSVSKQVS